MTTLITGGTGRTGLALAHLLHDAKRPLVIATRAGAAPAPFTAVRFEWYDFDSHVAALSAHDNATPTSKIDRVYIVKPPLTTDAVVVTSFIDLAISKGVTRFVLLSSTQVGPDPSSNSPGSVIHQYLIDRGVEYAVLRPTWFMQNFDANFKRSIRDYDYIFSATHDGKIPWVSTDDIAQVAFECLTATQSPNKDIFVVGPELLSYEDVAAIASKVLERPIRFKRYTLEEQAAFYISLKWDPKYAKFLAELDTKIAQGSEEAVFVDPETEKNGRKYVGKRTLFEYFVANKKLWIKQ
ncbi:Agroclavine dehydrogenase [Psilocybe cubensis]|uniref:NmrA-like domain-containing protein n=2 Tax=Psilocybe cubensis TaxID=181762 RepID=A0A8H8CS22_PSICU|nr:Agroclavine dehydrogenase [Psilocybe cubensis]KAH9487305.1 Agroclavine dehydrogenase [Psilocybe cubensis]